MEYLVDVSDANGDVMAVVATEFASERFPSLLVGEHGDFEVTTHFREVFEYLEPSLEPGVTAVWAVPATATEFTGDCLGICGENDLFVE
jgi:hypothetical protein